MGVVIPTTAGRAEGLVAPRRHLRSARRIFWRACIRRPLHRTKGGLLSGSAIHPVANRFSAVSRTIHDVGVLQVVIGAPAQVVGQRGSGPKLFQPEFAIGTDIEAVPATGLAKNFSPMPQMAPPPFGSEIAGGAVWNRSREEESAFVDGRTQQMPRLWATVCPQRRPRVASVCEL